MTNIASRFRFSVARLAVLIGLTFLPYLLTQLLAQRFFASDVAQSLAWPAPSFLLYALLNWLALALVVAVAGRVHLRACGLRLRLDRQRVVAAVLGFVAGVAIYLLVTWAMQALEVGRGGVRGMNFGLPGAAEVIVIAFSVVLTAPLCEEVFFRVVWIGCLGTRLPVWLAAAASIAAFSTIHHAYFGPGGVMFIAVWSVVPVSLFVLYGDLSASLLMHVLNNTWAYLLVPVLFGSS